MIANITKGNHLKPIIDYNEEKVKKGEAKRLNFKNIPKEDPKYANALMLNLSRNSNRKDRFFHVSLNFPFADSSKITDDLLNEVADEYMNKFGFNEDHPFLVYKHFDTQHPHIHIVTTRIQSDGKAVSDSNDRYRSQKITRDLEKKYGLEEVNSVKTTQKEIPYTPVFSSLREKLNYYTEQALKKRKVTSLIEFKEYLNEYGLDVHNLKGIASTVKGEVNYNGLVYSSIGTEFKQNQKGIKASSLFNKPTYNNIEKQFHYNKGDHKKKKRFIKSKIEGLFMYYEHINLLDFKSKLETSNIEFNFKLDKNNTLVGLSHTDTVSGKKFTGENIGKNFTAKNMRQQLSMNDTVVKPERITEREYRKYTNYINQFDILNQLQFLTSLGFKIKKDGNDILINDYKNPNNKGYVLYSSKGADLNMSVVLQYANSKNINYSKENNIHFEYNRARIQGKDKLAEYYKNRIDTSDKNNLEKNINQFLEIHDHYNDIYYPMDNGEIPEDDIVLDVDRKKKKRRKGKRK